MKLAILAGDSPHHRALAAKLASRFDVVALVLSGNVAPATKARLAQRAARAVATRTAGRPLLEAWRTALGRCERDASLNGRTPTTRVAEVNEAASLDAIERAAPDLVVVSGTNLVKGALLEAVLRRGALNLHSGLSPYVRGGPNCTHWCLADARFHLIGNTVHLLDAGIDAGPVVASGATALTGDEKLPELHEKVILHGHDLLIEAVSAVAAGRALAAVPQRELGTGRTYKSADWNHAAMARAVKNFRARWTPDNVAGPEVRRLRAALKCVKPG